MATSNTRWMLDGPAGPMEILIDSPEKAAGIALVAHPHPLFGGANTNKVAYTLAHVLRDLGYVALRPNFRGVGRSGGQHDHGDGETDDLFWLLGQAQARWDPERAMPVALAGFSFGAYVQTRLARRLAEHGVPVEAMVLVGLPSGELEGPRRYQPEPVPPKALLIHGDRDTTVPLANVLAYAEPLDIPVTVVPGADHFFRGKLHVLTGVVERALGCTNPSVL